MNRLSTDFRRTTCREAATFFYNRSGLWPNKAESPRFSTPLCLFPCLSSYSRRNLPRRAPKGAASQSWDGPRRTTCV